LIFGGCSALLLQEIPDTAKLIASMKYLMMF